MATGDTRNATTRLRARELRGAAQATLLAHEKNAGYSARLNTTSTWAPSDLNQGYAIIATKILQDPRRGLPLTTWPTILNEGAWQTRLEAVFLDRDGVINENRDDHVKSWAEFRFLPGATEAISRLSNAGYRVFIVTNQAIINRGLVSDKVVNHVNELMLGELGRRGARVEAVEYCPHRADENCECRKPRPGLLLSLARRFGLDLTASVVIGDALADVEAGLTVGCKTILVLTGRGREQLARAAATGVGGFLVADDLSTATDFLVGTSTAVV